MRLFVPLLVARPSGDLALSAAVVRDDRYLLVNALGTFLEVFLRAFRSTAAVEKIQHSKVPWNGGPKKR